jgi:hypothetical protein
MSKEDTMTETEKLIERASYMIENPSAWDTFDQRGSDMIAALVEALTAWNTRPDEWEPVAWVCEGCEHVYRDPVADFASIQAAGAASCCPECKMRPLYTRPAPALDREGVARALRKTVMPKSVRITQYAGHVYDFGSLPGITDEIVGLLADAILAMVGGGGSAGEDAASVKGSEGRVEWALHVDGLRLDPAQAQDLGAKIAQALRDRDAGGGTAELGLVEGNVSEDEQDLARILCRREGIWSPNDLVSVNDSPLSKAWRYFVPRARAMLSASTVEG